MFFLPTRCTTTSLQLALNINSVHDSIRKAKLEFFLNLTKNAFTKEIIRVSINLNIDRDLTSEIIDIMTTEDDSIINSQLNIMDKVKATLYVIRVREKDKMKQNEEARQIKDILPSNDRVVIKTRLFNSLKFGV
ncbi:unnamed protein product [Brachionus calyciflorus]|uniref:Uncharacterized protein n=1 Tax=Brachionus calyciflorus TaxID=104777 RepID=A0A813Y7B6_9BILA|nr:unnamed protein product [Brachionus calyciflorus]